MMMTYDKTKNVPYIESLPYKLGETARISELMARNFYKNYVEKVCILEIDEFMILSHICAQPNLSQSDIAKLLYKGKAHIGKILNEMEQKGYIKRIINTSQNMMIKNTFITKKGQKLYDETNEAFRQLGTNILNEFSYDEIGEFIRLLDKFKATILNKYKLNF